MTAEPAVFLKNSHNPRIEGGHPWIYAGEIGRVEGGPSPGGIVRVADRRGHPVGRGYSATPSGGATTTRPPPSP
ncbi:MAG: hypothetical protein HYU38_06250 [Candidatus Tectomicrobia bacterium]|nr:hypothetical protein [Candidatus Tectomicrobia bacterium]